MDAAARLAAVRAELARQGLDGFILPCADPHLGEYMPEHDRRLEFLTGFSGSAGIAIVLPARAMVFSDGRYTLQLAQQTDPAVWERGHMGETPPPGWLAEAAPPGARIGYDPWLISEDGLAKYTAAGLGMLAVAANPVDAVWPGQPPPPAAPASIQPLARAGQPAAEKRAAVAAVLAAAGQDAAVLSDPASINWLLNIRGGDVGFTPFALGFALIGADGEVQLFMDRAKLSPEVRDWLGNAVAVQPPALLEGALARLAGKRVRVDAAGSAAWFGQKLRAAGATVLAGADPCLLPKARKNSVEQDGARAAHLRDGVALCHFLHAMHQAGGRYTELSAAALLDGFRAADPLYRGESFPAISGAGEDGAIIHYRVTPETDRPINPNEAYLIDSGGQYADGTTDVTRTLWMGPAPAPATLKDHYTRVLAGHLDLSALVFPAGVAGPHLDALARVALWQAGLDYDHGTGHGVGSYLSVHEGPAGFSRTAQMVPLAEGMILSNEPGYYLPGHYGIRIENLLLVRPANLPAARKPFLRFETLTLAPYARDLIDPALLVPAQIDQINTYHAHVLTMLAPLLSPAAAAWLAEACAGDWVGKARQGLGKLGVRGSGLTDAGLGAPAPSGSRAEPWPCFPYPFSATVSVSRRCQEGAWPVHTAPSGPRRSVVL